MKLEELKESSYVDGNANETDSRELNTELYEQHAIEETPFTAVRMDEKWYLLMGKHRLNGVDLKSKEECIEDARNSSWNRVMQVIMILIEENKKMGGE